ncbi:tRNA-intron lyase [Candidatus Geothermarchaeota archaeon]|nr:MAG: tRNA-intron lyase [Candidatus Geothermarchaeota archaeon]
MNEKKVPIAYLEETRAVIWDIESARRIFSMGFYGKPMGIYKPKSADFNVPLVLDLIEAAYLAKKGKIKLYDKRKGKFLSLKEIFEYSEKTYERFKEKFMVYEDLRDSGYVVTSGMKFGSTFAVYRKGPGIDHAPYIVDVMLKDDEIGSTEIIRAGRLATTVRKRFIIAVPYPFIGKVEYLLFKWWRA